MANTKPPEYDGVSTIEMAQVEITEGGFNVGCCGAKI